MADERVLRWRSQPARPVRTAREADAGAGTAMLVGSEARPSLAWPVSGPERPARALGAADVREELPWLVRNGRRAQPGAVGASGALPASASRTAASAARCMALPRHGEDRG
jgi:hypothetical protein